MLPKRAPDLLALLLCSLVGVALCPVATEAACPEFAARVSVGTISEPGLPEVSGLVASRSNTGVLWAHNDSGSAAELFALSDVGATLAIYQPTGATNFDWEDIALGPGPVAATDYLYVADIGDNAAQRTSVIVYRIPEPTIAGPGTFPLAGAVALEMVYPDGPRDAETLLSDPLTGDLFIVAKSLDGVSGIYRSAFPQPESGTTVMEHVGTHTFPGNFLERLTTAGDISADGESILVRTYGRAWLWPRDVSGSVADAMALAPCEVPMSPEPQGEAVAFDVNGDGYYTTSEQVDQPLYFYEDVTPVPALSAQGGAALVVVLHAVALRALRLRGRRRATPS